MITHQQYKCARNIKLGDKLRLRAIDRGMGLAEFALYNKAGKETTIEVTVVALRGPKNIVLYDEQIYLLVGSNQEATEMWSMLDTHSFQAYETWKSIPEFSDQYRYGWWMSIAQIAKLGMERIKQ
jgi:hypothetical protein